MLLAAAPSQPSFPSLVPAGGALLLLFAAGLLLWALGGRLLRPGLAIIGMLAGLPIGIWLGATVAPEVPPLLFAAGGAIAGLVVASLSYAIALSAVTAVLAGVVALMGAWSAADMGWIDADRAAARIDETTSAVASAPSLHGFDTITAILLGTPRSPETAPGAVSASTPPIADGAPPGLFVRVRQAVEHHWSAMPQPRRTLLTASLAAGVVVGFLFGLLFAPVAARFVSSLAGSILLLVAGMPLLSSFLGRGDDLLPARPAAWFVAISLLTIIGYGVQRMLAPAPKPEPRQA